MGETYALVDGVEICEINISYDNTENSQFSVKLPLSDIQFSCLQENDPKLGHYMKKSLGVCTKNFICRKLYFVQVHHG